MKLSKAQQEVVDKMREGYRLYYLKYDKTYNLLSNSDSWTIKTITINSLWNQKIIEVCNDYKRIAEYQLNKNYLNNEGYYIKNNSI